MYCTTYLLRTARMPWLQILLLSGSDWIFCAKAVQIWRNLVYLIKMATVMSSGAQMRHMGSQRKLVKVAVKNAIQSRPITKPIKMA